MDGNRRLAAFTLHWLWLASLGSEGLQLDSLEVQELAVDEVSEMNA
jgi:hypothetical protein